MRGHSINRRPKTLSRTSIHLFESRLRWVVIGFILVMLVPVCRAFQFQILEHDKWAGLAEAAQTMSKSLTLPRGPILDRDGRPLALSKDAVSIQVNTKDVGKENIKSTAATLAQILGMDCLEIEGLLRGRKTYVWIKRDISKDEHKLLRQAKLKGVFIARESARSYPSKILAANIIGFTGERAEGLEGIEYHHNDVLKGKAGQIVGVRDGNGKVFFPEGIHYEDRAAGGSVRLTIDHSIQHFTERALEKGWNNTRAKNAMALVIDPNRGEILAMAQRPTYDPNHALDYPPDFRCNKVVTSIFEPGSTLKPFVIAGALNSGAISPDDVFDCGNGEITIGEYKIRDTHPHTFLKPRAIIVKSSNICAFRVADANGPEAVYKTLTDFGFGSKTHAGLGGESNGILRPCARWGRIGLSNIAFGQGISVNCLQLASAFSALVNGGILIQPFIVFEVRDGEGHRVVKNGPRIINDQVIKPAVSEMVTDFMTGVVRPGGTGTRAALDNYTVAGKTGTSQKANERRAGYSEERVGSFIGAVPARDPKVVILVVLDEPQGTVQQKYGGSSAGPVFKEIAEGIMSYYSVSGQAPKTSPNLFLKMAKAAAKPKKKKRVATAPVNPHQEEEWDMNEANRDLANVLQLAVRDKPELPGVTAPPEAQ